MNAAHNNHGPFAIKCKQRSVNNNNEGVVTSGLFWRRVQVHV